MRLNDHAPPRLGIIEYFEQQISVAIGRVMPEPFLIHAVGFGTHFHHLVGGEESAHDGVAVCLELPL